MGKSGQICAKRCSFEVLHNIAIDFVAHLNERLAEKEVYIEIEPSLPSRRIPIVKKRAGELSTDEARQIDTSPSKTFERDVYFVIIDTAVQQIKERFIFNEELLKDIAQLNPRNFKNLQSANMSCEDHMLRKLAQLTGTNRAELFRELIQFATYYEDYNAVQKT